MTLRNAIFQAHWLLGITAGIVLAIVGATGGILSFEDEILAALNPGVMTVQPRGEALPAERLVERVHEQRPGAAITSLQLSADPHEAAVVGFAPGDGGRRGERRHLDPYTGELLGEPRYRAFFGTTMRLHRWLVADDIGKQIVGASTVVLVFFCVSGLYLRWPRRWTSIRTWLALDWRQKGRNFLWHLHSVVGTWALLAYLVMALSGLWWSYGWYRDAVNAWAAAGAPAPARAAAPAAHGDPPSLDVGAAWRTFDALVPAWSSATLSWPRDGDPIEFRYLDADPAHERARDTLTLDPWTLQRLSHERYDDAGWRQKIGASMFALHRGSFFGTGGVVAFMLASLLMPVFTITGWMLYLDRRRRQRAATALAREVGTTGPAAVPFRPGMPDSGAEAAVLVLHASQTGTAEALAWRTTAALREAGCTAEVQPLGTLSPEDLAGRSRVLFVVSTFGEGEPPDPARAFTRQLRTACPPLPALHYGVLALGDSDYDESFCGFGRELDRRLHHSGAQPLFDRVEVDCEDAAALRHWQHHIGQLCGRTDVADWRPPDYRRWRLLERRLLNPGSAGGPAFHLALAPENPADLRWQAGDIAEIGPRNLPADLTAWLDASGLDGNAGVRAGGLSEPLRDVLGRSVLPDPTSVRGRTPQQVAGGLAPLPHREYSIASIPADGSLQLLVRRMQRPDGGPGSGSGWLTEGAAPGDAIDLRIRSNPGFHPPGDDRPLLLIGNGTGLAGLRAVLKARLAAGHRRNWLLFGERNAAHDSFHGEELEDWWRAGGLQRLDRVFSRDRLPGGETPEPEARPRGRYVQHALARSAPEVQRWVADGAAIYVCGSLEGMAPGVDAVLTEILGRDALEAMAADGRYRRDVY